MKPNISVAKIPLFSFLFSGNLGKTMSISLSNIWCAISFNDSICCLWKCMHDFIVYSSL